MPVKLGELLLKENMVTPQQLREAVSHQKMSGGKLSKAFVKLGYLRDEEIASLLSRQYGFPSVDLSQLEVDPAIRKLIPAETCRKHQILPLFRSGATLTIAMADPTDVFAMDDIKFMTGYNIEPVVASEVALEEALEKYYGGSRGLRLHSSGASQPAPVESRAAPSLKQDIDAPGLAADDLASIGLSEVDVDSIAEEAGEVEEVAVQDDEINLGALAESAPVVKLSNMLLIDALKRGASDIHIEPYEKQLRVRFRIDGVLHNMITVPLKLRDPLISRIKIMSKLDIAERRLPQDGRIRVRIRIDDRAKEMDLRVSCLPTLWGEKVVLRLLDKSQLMLDMTKLGFEPESLEKFQRNIAKPYGVVLVTGPTGSGKTTTLYSALASLNKTDTNIMAAEDPIEYDIAGINQVQVRENIGLTFAAVLRSFLRQDPNTILVGEIRDFETAEISVKASLTGHLVLATLHTNDAPSTISRLVNMGIEPFMVGTAMNLVQSQRLIRRICKECEEEVSDVPRQTLTGAGFTPEEAGGVRLLKGKGCGACDGTGYKGRVGLYEVMEMSDGLRDLVLIGASSIEIRKQAVEEGMITLRRSGIAKIKQGVTTLDEVLRETVI